MLVELRVENLGIIASASLMLGRGMTVITGETGAGKTLLVEALDLLLGGRADPALVRDGSSEARVEGRFVATEGHGGTGGDERDVELDVQSDVEIEVVLTRVVPTDGRSRAYVNGRLATAGELMEIGRLLVDVHGQHAHQSLLAPAEQRALLDRFAGDGALAARSALRAAREETRRLDAEMALLGGDERSRMREADLLRYQLAEIDAAALSDGSEEDLLASEEALLGDAEAVGEALRAAYDEVTSSVLDALGAAVGELARRPPLEPLAERLRALQAEASDVAHELRTVAEETVADPMRLEEVRARRRLIADLTRKYGEAVAGVLSYADDARRRLAEIEGHDARAGELSAAKGRAEGTARDAASRLSGIRRAAAEPLAEAVTSRLRELAMPAASFEVAIEDGESGEDGSDSITFLLAPNPGEPARPLARAASGGELSRAMLALRVVLSEAPPTLVFDEVDAGIGGEAGTAVGRALASLGRKHQVLCVTHLAQVAAFADAHFVVGKIEADARTTAEVTPAVDDARIGELSRMLAGVGESEHARRHARELVDAAKSVQHDVRGR